MNTKARCTDTSIRVAIGFGAVGPLLIFGAAGVAGSTPPPALSDGTYLVAFSDGPTEEWTITSSCGPGCAVVASSVGWSADANFVGGGYWGPSNWVVVVPGPDAAICPDGTKVAGSQNYGFDPVTLTGKKSSEFKMWPDCDGHGGGYGHPPPPSTAFTMTKTA
jgi:hypothetical protein